MFPQGTLLAVCTALLCGPLCQAADQDAFQRPNENKECGAQPMDFMAYAEGLDTVTCGSDVCEYKEQAATLFDLQYRKGYKVVEYTTSPELENTPINSATYILYPCGDKKPDDEFIKGKVEANSSEVHFLEIPLTAVATEDSSVGWMLEELGVLDRVRFGGSYSTSPCMQKISAEDGCGRLFVAEFGLDPNAEETTPDQYDALFGFASDVERKNIYLQASADLGPLARAEHIVYLSAFFNMEAKGLAYYKKVKDSYTKKAKSATASASAPTVMWITTHSKAARSRFENPDGEPISTGIAAQVSFDRFKTLLTKDAGGALCSQAEVANITGAFATFDDIMFAESEYDSKAEMLEALQSALEGVDVLIDETYYDVSVDDLVKFLGLKGTDIDKDDFPFLGENIWRHDKAQSAAGSDDWFGEATARPDFVQTDLKEILFPGSVPKHKFRYFRNLSKGENVTVTGPDECTDFTCDSYANQAAIAMDVAAARTEIGGGAPAKAPAESPAEPPDASDTSDVQSLFASAVTASAVLATLI